jgi:thiamine biosynthesis lipoprotein
MGKSKLDGSRVSATEAFHFDFFAMGSPCALSLYARAQGDAARVADVAIAEVSRIERRYSRYIAESLLSRINSVAKAGDSICVDTETAYLIDHAFTAHARSQGLFDVTSGLMRQIWNDEIELIPREEEIAAILGRVGLDKVLWRRPTLTFLVPGMELDFGGVVKEYAADRAADVCRLSGARHGLVNLGGDIAVVGPHPDAAPWRIGIRDPMGGEAAVATLFVASGGVATSGNYERYFEVEGRRYSHAINPKTGWPVASLPSVTVAAETCLSAGMTSSIALLMGEACPQWLSTAGAAHLYVEATGKLGGSILS